MTYAANVFIQWNGTNVCFDFACSCGWVAHVDDTHAYVVRCHDCGTLWEMPQVFALREVRESETNGGIVDTPPDSEEEKG